METPEQQLLNLIQKASGGPAVAAAPAPTAPVKSVPKRAAAAPARASVTGRVFQVRLEALRLSTLNLLLSGAIIVVGVYMVFSVMSSVRESRRALDVSGNPNSAISRAAQSSPFVLKDIAYYEERIGERDIFHIGGKISKSQKEVEIVKKAAITELTNNLRLVGISWSDTPDAMIEDTAKSVTYFLRPGESMENGVRVKEITKDMVLLEYDKETFELK